MRYNAKIFVTKALLGALLITCLTLIQINASFAGILSPLEKHDYLIITNNALFAPFLRLTNFCNSVEKLNTVIYTTEFININYTGVDLKAKIRNFIKEAYTAWGIKYVLLGGDTEIIPAFYMLGYSAAHGSKPIPTDMYYSGLDGNWEVKTVGTAQSQQVDMYEEVCIGRAPVNNVTEANYFVDKTIRYKTYGNQWRKNVLMLGEVILPQLGAAGLADTALNNAAAALTKRNVGYNIEKLYDVFKKVLSSCTFLQWNKNTLRTGGYVPPTYTSYVHGVNNMDYNLIIHFGHGQRAIIMRHQVADLALFTNYNPFIAYSLACYSASFDGYDHGLGWAADGDCMGEKIVTTKYGAVALIGNSRNGLGSTTQLTTGPTIDCMYAFVNKMNGTRRLGEVLRSAKQEIYNTRPHNIGDWEWAIAELNLLGDPTLIFDR